MFACFSFSLLIIPSCVQILHQGWFSFHPKGDSFRIWGSPGDKLSFCLPENALISPSFLKYRIPRFNILGWQLFFLSYAFSNIKPLFHCVVASVVWSGSQFFVPSKVIFFPQTNFKIFSFLSLVFYIFIRCGFPFIDPFWDSFSFLNLWTGASFVFFFFKSIPENSQLFSPLLRLCSNACYTLSLISMLPVLFPYLPSFYHSVIHSVYFLVLSLELI